MAGNDPLSLVELNRIAREIDSGRRDFAEDTASAVAAAAKEVIAGTSPHAKRRVQKNLRPVLTLPSKE